ncbi:MAG: hypothetical protein AMS17_01175 [Spirochaetes bacterium DG_61]|nr:MAG: hypothetical protein AMS17_01175 [Spirochaetes bacterium DG_61]
MKTIATVIIIFSLFLIFLVSCGKNKKGVEETTRPEEKGAELTTKEEVVEGESVSESETGYNVEDIGTIERFTPEIFVQVTILYKKESSKWIKESGLLPADEQNRYIERANRLFFSQFGITEQDYLEYSQNNVDELNRFLEEYPELLSQLKGY